MTEQRPPVARIEHADYENIRIDCPQCNRPVTYNRASDLSTFDPIAGNAVDCLWPDCAKPLWVVGDRVNEAHEMILDSCVTLLEQKRYMECVTQVCQAYEMFFNLHLHAELVYRPFSRLRNSEGLKQLNARAQKLHSEIEPFAFQKMRRLSLHLVCQADEHRPMTKETAHDFIEACGRLSKRTPDETMLRAQADQRVASTFIKIAESTIGEERNRVAHKFAYRPTFETTHRLLDEARHLLLPQSFTMKLHSNVMA